MILTRLTCRRLGVSGWNSDECGICVVREGALRNVKRSEIVVGDFVLYCEETGFLVGPYIEGVKGVTNVVSTPDDKPFEACLITRVERKEST